MADRFDILILGGGPGGVAAAIRGAQLGASVGIIEDGMWGGLCLNRACIPTKLFGRSTESLLTLEAEQEKGIRSSGYTFDYGTVLAQRKDLVMYLSMGTKGLVGSNGVKLIEGRGALTGPGTVRVGNDEYSGKSVILATGGKWVVPGIEGIDSEGVINPTQFQEESELPGRTLILGGQPWGLELGQFLAAAGKEAVVVESDRTILPDEDRQLTRRLRPVLNQGGLRILTQTDVTKITKGAEGLKVEFSGKDAVEPLVFDRILITEREPALEGIGLESVGLTDLQADECGKTRVPGVYAIGDLIGGPVLSHLASAQGIVAAENAMGGNSRVNPNAVPRVVYTRPQYASVGLTEKKAKEAGYQVLTGLVPFGVNAMAMIQGQTDGAIKVVGDAEYGELLGVHIMGPFASEIIGQGVLAVQMEATLEDLACAALPHPTLSESLADAARDALGRAIYLPK